MKIDAIYEGLYKTYKDNANRIAFVVCGRKGTGKSSITKYIADRFKETGVFLRVFTFEENDVWLEKDRFAIAHRDRSITLTGQKQPDTLTPVMNIIDEIVPFEDFSEEHTDPQKESVVIITRDVNGFLTYMKNNREECQKFLILMPIKEYVCFKSLITNYMHVISVNHSKNVNIK